MKDFIASSHNKENMNQYYNPQNLIEKSKKSPLKVLFIGNSYTFFNNSWDIFKDICLAEGFPVEVDSVTAGGYTLQQMHDINDQFGKQTKEKIQSAKFDVVFLQEQSLRPATNEKPLFFEYATKLIQMVKDAGAIPFLYQTWGRKEGSKDLETIGLTSAEMTKKIAQAYAEVGQKAGLEVSRVGTAFYLLYSNNFPQDLYDEDLTHPSKFGSYVVALTHFATLFKKSPVSVKLKYFENDALQLQCEKAVEKAVFEKVKF